MTYDINEIFLSYFMSQNIIKYHIFSVQKFNLNHEQLWKSLKWRFLLMDFLEEVKKKNITASIKILIRIFFKYPLQLSKFFLLKLKKKYTISKIEKDL